MKKVLLLAAAAALAFGAGPALAAKKQLVIVVKGLDNPFFESIHQGCEKWNGENKDSEYECFYTGPASTSDEAGEAQILQDILGKADTAAVAISPSNATLIAQTIRSAPRRPSRSSAAMIGLPVSEPRTACPGRGASFFVASSEFSMLQIL